MSLRIVRPALALVVVLGLILAGAPGAGAQDDRDFVLELRVEGTLVRVVIAEVSIPLGAIEFDIVGLPLLADECQVITGFGVCSEVDGVVRLAAINPTGWTEPQDLMMVTATSTIADSADIGIEIGQGTDVGGVGLVGETRTVVDGNVDSDEGSGSLLQWVLIAAVAGGLVAAGLVMAAKRRGSSRSAAELDV